MQLNKQGYRIQTDMKTGISVCLDITTNTWEPCIIDIGVCRLNLIVMSVTLQLNAFIEQYVD